MIPITFLHIHVSPGSAMVELTHSIGHYMLHGWFGSTDKHHNTFIGFVGDRIGDDNPTEILVTNKVWNWGGPETSWWTPQQWRHTLVTHPTISNSSMWPQEWWEPKCTVLLPPSSQRCSAIGYWTSLAPRGRFGKRLRRSRRSGIRRKQMQQNQC